ncbi:hypothetical protein ACHHYP_01810 [Achlya hypogyna]|uniref:START domain-containing protein n=1 Tax=Achlya hypogyna TaxID=1202772 RepID=A0A1V9ZTK8_ACHHY|nr:hypothetical protein ACHHYP_01810 [Achlya hypogyna]
MGMEPGAWGGDLPLLDDNALFDMLHELNDDAPLGPATARGSDEFKERERERKVQYRRRVKEEVLAVRRLAQRLEEDRNRLRERQAERRLAYSVPGQREAIEHWSVVAKEHQRYNAAALLLGQSLRDSLRHQINLAMSYQRTLYHMNQAFVRHDRRSSFQRMLQEHMDEGLRGYIRWKLDEAKDRDNQCHVTLNSARTDIAQVDVVRCSRRVGIRPADATDAIWRRLTGESTHNVPATRIAQRLDTIDSQTCFTRVYLCDTAAPFALNVVQHRYNFPDKHIIVYRTVEEDDPFQLDVLKWRVMCWVEIRADGDDTRIHEYIRYIQGGSGGLLPILLGCHDTDAAAALTTWMERVVASLYSCCAD